MCRRCPNHARIAKPSARLTPEEDAARFVLAWERRMIRNGRAWRKPNPNGSTYAGNRVFTWLAVPYWTRHARRYDKSVGKFGDWVDGPLVSVPQSKLVLRPAGCTCDRYFHGRHENYPQCPLWKVGG